MDESFSYVFPAIRGVQARREYYVSMCPMALIPKIFIFDEEILPAELRAQRLLNKARLPELTRYILENRDNYVFSALTASVDGDVAFTPFGDGVGDSKVGLLRVPMGAKFIINDGQHRRAAMEAAMKERPELADETVPVVFFLDIGLERCQQMFADLNRYAIRPSTSLGVLYDHRDHRAILAKKIVAGSPVFRDIVEVERNTLSARSKKLFTLSAVYRATNAFLAGRDGDPLEAVTALAIEFWEESAKQFPEWALVRDGRRTAGEVRRDYIHSSGLVLQSLGRVGNKLVKRRPKGWKTALRGLRKLDWRRENSECWEGRAMVGGRLLKSSQHVSLTSNKMKEVLGLPLTPEEQRLEDTFLRGEHGR